MSHLIFALAALALLLGGRPAYAQDTLGVERLQDAALKNDPRAAQRTLLRQATDLRLAVIAADRLPQFELNGQGTHQSDVTRPTFGVPGITVPDFPKDRWQTTLDVEQRLYDGGEIARRRELEEARHAESQAALNVSLYQLRSEVNSAFFSAFLLEQRSAEYEALVTDLDARLAAVRARVEAGTALSRDAAEIEAERVRAGLQRDEARASRRASLAILPTWSAGRSTRPRSCGCRPRSRSGRSPRRSTRSPRSAAAPSSISSCARARGSDREVAYASVENRPRVVAFGQAGWACRGWMSSAPRRTHSGRRA